MIIIIINQNLKITKIIDDIKHKKNDYSLTIECLLLLNTHETTLPHKTTSMVLI